MGNLRIHLAWAVVTLAAAGAWGRWCTPTARPARPPQQAASEISTSAPSTTTTNTAAKPTPSTPATASSSAPLVAPAFPAYTYEVLTVEQIRTLIRSDVKHDWWRAIRVIGKLVDLPLRQQLLRELSSCKDDSVRLSCLSMLQDRSMIQNALKNDPSDFVRAMSATALAKIGGEGTVEALLEATHDADISVRVNAAEALLQFGRTEAAAELVRSLEPSLTSPDDAVRHDAVDNLTSLRCPAAIPALVRALRDENREIRDLGYRGLSAFDAPVVTPVLERLRQDPDPRVAEAAKEILEGRPR